MTAPMSDGFTLFTQQFPVTAQTHMAFVQAKAKESALDPKTNHLSYADAGREQTKLAWYAEAKEGVYLRSREHIAVLCAAGLTSGLPFHVQLARQAGASREEVLSACLVGLQAVGLVVIDGFEVAYHALDGETDE